MIVQYQRSGFGLSDIEEMALFELDLFLIIILADKETQLDNG